MVDDRHALSMSGFLKMLCPQALYRSPLENLGLNVFGFCLALLAVPPKKHEAKALINPKRVRVIAMTPKPDFLDRKCVFSALVNKHLRYKILTGALP